MWVPKEVAGWFQISKDTVAALREELAAVKAERDAFKSEVMTSRISQDWLRVKVNQLELQNTALLEKAYDIKVPAPEIIRQPSVDPKWDPRNFSFEDVGNEMAGKLGLPLYGDKDN